MTKPSTHETEAATDPAHPFDSPLLRAGVKGPSLRHTALEMAIQHHAGETNKMANKVVETARQFETFLRGEANAPEA